MGHMFFFTEFIPMYLSTHSLNAYVNASLNITVGTICSPALVLAPLTVTKCLSHILNHNMFGSLDSPMCTLLVGKKHSPKWWKMHKHVHLYDFDMKNFCQDLPGGFHGSLFHRCSTLGIRRSWLVSVWIDIELTAVTQYIYLISTQKLGILS